ncbi:MAG TPA: hypothetical protein VK879_01300, partial [Candidatus Sulfomarinibacteraceae bacterium]|nr:hypothetical protein [Candidatus Sulfomarinibacteraceae bacterium]
EEETPATSATPLSDAVESESTQEPAPTAPATSTEVASEPADEEPAPTVTEDGQSGVRGVVTAYSDVGSLPDEPLAQQTVVIMPLEAAGALLGTTPSPTPDELRFLQMMLPDRDERITLAVSDAAGRYEATLEPGEYVLCLADAAGPSPTDYPLAVRGCGAFMVPPGAVVEVNVSSGFGEILLEAG